MVHADIDFLQQVLLHRPDRGAERVNPENARELLYNDIICLPEMQKEHDLFARLIKAFIGEDQLFYFETLLEEVLEIKECREKLWPVLSALEGKEFRSTDFDEWTGEALCQFLITGYHPEKKEHLLNPIPNLIFTRDIGTVINDHLLTCHAMKMPRKRESLLSWCIFHFHPLFDRYQKEGKFLDLSGDWESLRKNLVTEKTVSIEGGDVMILSEDHLLIGVSERTQLEAVEAVALQLFTKGVVEKITVAEIPKEAYCMHIDTLFSQINTHDYVLYGPILLDQDQVKIRQLHRSGEVKSFPTFQELLKDLDPEVRIILCGNGEYPHDRREQWTSACNFVALQPGVVITYRRNQRTLEALQAAGYQLVDVEQLVEQLESGKLDPRKLENTIIRIPSGELSRAGGGPHCLTMPLLRKG